MDVIESPSGLSISQLFPQGVNPFYIDSILHSKGVKDISALEKANDSETYDDTVVKAEGNIKKYKAYPDATKKELEVIERLEDAGSFCFDSTGKKISAKKAKKLFVQQMTYISETILKRIETFVWTINRDGRDYHPSNPCGCSGVTKMGAKEKVRGTHCTIAEHGRIKMTKNNFTNLNMGK